MSLSRQKTLVRVEVREAIPYLRKHCLSKEYVTIRRSSFEAMEHCQFAGATIILRLELDSAADETRHIAEGMQRPNQSRIQILLLPAVLGVGRLMGPTVVFELRPVAWSL